MTGEITTNECASMRLLARDGWTIGELKMTMQLSDNRNVRYHVEGDCEHDHSVSYIRDWDGQNPPDRLSAKQRA